MPLSTIRLPFENRLTEPKEDRRVRNGIDPVEGHLTREWALAFSDMQDLVNQAPIRLQVASATGQSASIGATALAVGALNAGLYQLQYYMRITQAATTSSSLEVTFDWTDAGQSMNYTFPALTANTVTSFQSGILLVEVTANTPVRYSTTYASVGATAMVYKLSVVISRVSA